MADQRLRAVRSALDHHRFCVPEALGEVGGDMTDASRIGRGNMRSGAQFTIDQCNNGVDGSTRQRGTTRLT